MTKVEKRQNSNKIKFISLILDRHILAIGGGGFGRSNGSGKIEQYLLKLSNRKKPNICFIPTASGDNDSYKASFYSLFTTLKCHPSHIDFFKRTKNIKKHIQSQDVIFVGGGNTKSMLAVWKDWELDHVLKDAYSNGVIMSGVSAGAICWFARAITDSWQDELSIIEGMNFIEGTCCPHFDEEPEREPFVRKSITSNLIDHCFAIEGESALHIVNEITYESVNFGENKRAYKLHKEDNNIKKTTFKVVKLN